MQKIYTIVSAVIIGALVVGGYYYYQTGTLHLTLSDGKTKVRVPSSIVRAKDCDQYKKWFHSKFPPMTARNNRCPWSKLPNSPIAEFILNGVTFYVPREFLWQNTHEPDEEVDSIYLIFKYPEMSPPKGAEENKDYNITLAIRSTKTYTNCLKQNTCDQISQEWYENSTNIDYNKNKNIENIVTKLYELPAEQLTVYEVNNRRDYIIKGDPLKPDYWLRCSSREYEKGIYNPACETYVNYNEKFYFEYHFGRHFLLQHHDDVRNKVLEKINQFQQKPIEEN